MEDVAHDLGMSVSGFHHQFKSVTAMSPLQYQKQIRLQGARRLMLGGDLDAASAGFKVGYEKSIVLQPRLQKTIRRPAATRHPEAAQQAGSLRRRTASVRIRVHCSTSKCANQDWKSVSRVAHLWLIDESAAGGWCLGKRKFLLEFGLRTMPGWRNGRRCGLKIRCPKGRAGSTPALGTTLNLYYYNNLHCSPYLPRAHCWFVQELDRNLESLLAKTADYCVNIIAFPDVTASASHV